MITRLDQIPALTRSWLAPLEEDDPELWEELAESLVIDPASAPVDAAAIGPFPDVAAVLAQLDLAGKEIGAFRFAPAPGASAGDQLAAFQAQPHARFDITGDTLFVGAFGQDWVAATPGDLALVGGDGTMLPLARGFGPFLIAQANAYDSFKRHIVKGNDEDAYRAEAEACAAEPSLADAHVLLIYGTQLKA